MLLAIESSGVGYSVAIASADDAGRATLHTHVVGDPSAGPSAARLLSAIEFALADAGCPRGDVRDIAIAIGPGGFTGLRVGLTIAKTLAAQLGARLIGVPSLAAHALFHLEAGGYLIERLDIFASGESWVATATDARRKQLYGAAWRIDQLGDSHGVFEDGPFRMAAALALGELVLGPVCCSAKDFCTQLRSTTNVAKEKAFFMACAPNLAGLEPLWTSQDGREPEWDWIGGRAAVIPTAREVALLALAAIRGGRADDWMLDPAEAEPHYVRGADAKLPRVPQQVTISETESC